MVEFIAALVFILGTPGPGVLSLAAVGSAFGWPAGLRYGVGLFVGSNLVMVAAAAGLAVVFETVPALRIGFVVLSSGYLLWLASRVARAGASLGFDAAAESPGFGGGVALQIFNPKAYAVGTFVFSNFPLLPDRPIVEIAVKLVVLNAVWVPIHLAWLAAGVGLRRLDMPPRIQHRINVAMALALVLVVALAIGAFLRAE